MKRNGISLLAVATVMLLLASACGRSAQVKELSVVPEPVFMVQKEGSFTLHSSLKMSVTGIGQNSPTIKYVMKMLRSAHFRPSLVSASQDSDVELVLNDTLNTELGDEGYLLEVRNGGIRLSANTEQGLFYAFQTLLQLFPADVTTKRYSSVTMMKWMFLVSFVLSLPFTVPQLPTTDFGAVTAKV